MTSLGTSPKSFSCWHVLYMLARQKNPCAFFHFTSWDVKPPWQMIFQSFMSKRLVYASSRKITSAKLSIHLLKLFCFVTCAIRLNGTIWNTGEKRLVLPLSEAPMPHGTGPLCSFCQNSARKSQNAELLDLLVWKAVLKNLPEVFGIGFCQAAVVYVHTWKSKSQLWKKYSCQQWQHYNQVWPNIFFAEIIFSSSSFL